MSELALGVGPSPHIVNTRLSTRGLMIDVLIGLLPVVVAAVLVFGWAAVLQICLATVACLLTEAVAGLIRGQRFSLGDGSAAITGIILGLSLPWSAPAYVPIIAGLAAIGLGKVVFGGLGHNLFNPAMVGRAFVMISFGGALGAGSYVLADGGPILSQATPLSAARAGEPLPDLWALFLGNCNGSLGEASILANLLGGAWLCLRRTAAWEIPVALIGSFMLFVLLGGLLAPVDGLPALGLGVLPHVCSGSVVFGAFFIATDPVSSPLTRSGKVVFAVLVAFVVWVLRVFSNYPEGLMFAILVANAMVPLINRWLVPTPVGGVKR